MHPFVDEILDTHRKIIVVNLHLFPPNSVQ